jgi:RHS repeat-associated protein
VKKVSAAGTTWYVWEGGAVIAEYGAAPVGASNIRYYHPDRLSTRMITDSMGAVVGTQDHLPFGEDAGVTGENEKHRFTNYERDAESGTDYAVNRQYANSTGRFLQVDQVLGDLTDPQSFNRYSYTVNDPISFADPDGLQYQSICPAQFTKCVDVTVCIGHLCGRVMVGLDGLGGGTFIWGNSTFTNRQLLFLWDSKMLPQSFSLSSRLEINRSLGVDVESVRKAIYNKFNKELSDCEAKARADFDKELKAAGINLEYYKSRVAVQPFAELWATGSVVELINGASGGWKKGRGIGGKLREAVKGIGLVQAEELGIARGATGFAGALAAGMAFGKGLNAEYTDFMEPQEIQKYMNILDKYAQQAATCKAIVRKKFGL